MTFLYKKTTWENKSAMPDYKTLKQSTENYF